MLEDLILNTTAINKILQEKEAPIMLKAGRISKVDVKVMAAKIF